MLKTIALKALVTAIKLLVTKDLLVQIKEAVLAVTSLQISGAEKKALVDKELSDVKAELKKSFGNMGSMVFGAAIDYVHLKVNLLNEEL